MDMWIAIGFLVICTLVGLSTAWYNLNDEESHKYRLEMRRAERKGRKKPLWYQMIEKKNEEDKE